ncbi:MAG: hypothetical protein H0X40_15905 [Chthoniobacterales bacterium]|nr:hypothetical protein [Chthoniobacterales bacterium]
MGRIVVKVVVENASDRSKRIETDALVDTGAYITTLPAAWKSRLGEFPSSREIMLETATQETVSGEICGPVFIQMPGFPQISSEVLFLPMEPEDGKYEPLIGYVTLEQSQAAVDMVGHRLTHVRYADLK